MKRYFAWMLISVSGLAAAQSAPALAQQTYGNVEPTLNDLGGVGLLQMPSARHADEGEFSLQYYDNQEYRRMSVSLQLFPWLETVIRYNDIRTRLYSSDPSFSGDQTYKDRGVDVKFRLLEESYWLPETSIGLRDLAGTGKFSGEFIAASKRVGPLDFTLGLGFGYLGRRDSIGNPFCQVADKFCTRPTGTKGRGGSFEVDEWFRGNSALFGGVEYQTPWQPLTLKLEYDGNDYSDEPSGTPIIQDSPWNYGLHYRVNDYVNVQLSYERGNTLMFGFSIRTNFNDISQVKKPDSPQPPKMAKTQSLQQVPTEQLVQQLYQDAGWAIQKVRASNNGKKVAVYGTQRKYRDKDKALIRGSRVLAGELPNSVEQYEFVETSLGAELSSYQVDAQTTKQAWFKSDLTTVAEDAYQQQEVPSMDDSQVLFDHPHTIKWPNFGIRPRLDQSFGGPENFYAYQLLAQIDMGWLLQPNLYVDGRIGVNLLTNYDEFNYLVDNYEASLPRVRTYVREYVTFSDVWLAHLQATYVKQLSQDWYASVYGGYFERMFGGAGTEWMYRPLMENWAVGVDVNWAKQRSFESYTGFRDYHVVTGHLTGYWQPKFLEKTTVQLALGRFLAGDEGVQLNVSKQFDSGVIVGAYAAKTNVSASEYGEGSFTKGFYISIPLDLFQRDYTRGYGTIGWTPLTRDGGQMLERQTQLFGVTNARSDFYAE
ncbi:YjbH domain-containing protein [Idiomarina tyrosinivorans]|uniref:YjbH domain-containing protein n=1 Tax=Idiomarina tyrosinivorans TaxID=1445662 RepID=A0A432ZR19_9GAMM|nr:YjbH domain-containing protein [Idiomarina tyrosinivorans]RUO80276.1 YjbH domain-containing protein [Idiomarina tyrosinivorans]